MSRKRKARIWKKRLYAVRKIRRLASSLKRNRRRIFGLAQQISRKFS
ncbi:MULTISPECIES: hypothetical protein [Blautia]|nr:MULTISPECIES: hypothetical protein [Blautia]